MALFIDLFNLRNNEAGTILRNRVATAISVSADKIMTGADNVAPFSQVAGAHDLRVIWAKENLGRTEQQAPAFLEVVLARNKNATVAQITGALDSAVEDNVDSAVDLFAGVAV